MADRVVFALPLAFWRRLGPGEQRALTHPAGTPVTWSHRGNRAESAPVGSRGAVARALRDLSLANILRLVEISPETQRCATCGCVQDLGCDDGCWWIAPDRCSSCVGVRKPLEGKVLR